MGGTKGVNSGVKGNFKCYSEANRKLRTLARGPVHGAAAEEVDVEVVDGLAAVGAGVDDEAVAVGEVLLASDFCGDVEEVAEHGGVVLHGVGVGGEVVFGDDEDVDRGLGVDVGKGEDLVVFVDGLYGDFPVRDFAEETGHGSE
jgi:hypothetical protein